jgi:hypothetical protein
LDEPGVTQTKAKAPKVVMPRRLLVIAFKKERSMENLLCDGDSLGVRTASRRFLAGNKAQPSN